MLAQFFGVHILTEQISVIRQTLQYFVAALRSSVQMRKSDICETGPFKMSNIMIEKSEAVPLAEDHV